MLGNQQNVKTHSAPEQPAAIGDNPHPMELANFILWKFLQMPPGGLYAKWDEEQGRAVWFCSQERDYIFRLPRQDSLIYEEHDRSRFRSIIFRLGSLCGEELCGSFEMQYADRDPRRFSVHASFYPEHSTGLWIAITSRDEHPAGKSANP